MKRICLSILFVLFFSISAIAVVVTPEFAWDPNTESDLAGYKLYVATLPEGPFSLIKDIGIPDCQTYPGECRYTLDPTDFDYGTYHFTLTAYDTSNNESDPSNTAILVIEETPPPDTQPPAPPTNFRTIIQKIIAWIMNHWLASR